MTESSTLQQTYTALIRRLRDGGIETAETEARWILKKRGDYEWADLIARPEQQIDSNAQTLMEKDCTRRLAGEPLSRIYGEREFRGLVFKLSPETLDPRPDTETLIDVALQTYGSSPPQTILDLGTGTGCIPITLLKEWPQAQAVAVDLSEEALETARENAKLHGVEGRIRFMRSDWWQNISGRFDLITTNPPYIARTDIPNLSREVQNHDPILALEGGEDGLQAYKTILTEMKDFMNPNAIGLFEIGFDQQEKLERLVKESGFSMIATHRDLAGLPRVVKFTCGDK